MCRCITMDLCNVSTTEDGTAVMINALKCNVTVFIGNKDNVSPVQEEKYNGEGAFLFSIAVVVVYGLAVIGVLTMGFCTRRKLGHAEMDKEADSYIKQIDGKRQMFEKKRRKGLMTNILKKVQGETSKYTVQAGILQQVSLSGIALSSPANDTLQTVKDRQQNGHCVDKGTVVHQSHKLSSLTVIHEDDNLTKKPAQTNGIKSQKGLYSHSNGVYITSSNVSATESSRLLSDHRIFNKTESCLTDSESVHKTSRTESTDLGLPEIDFEVDDEVFLSDDVSADTFYDTQSNQYSPDWVDINKQTP